MSPPLANLQLNLHIAVRQLRAAEFEHRVVDRSTPGHSLYGQHMSREQVKDFLKPATEVSRAILDWLDITNVPKEDITDDGDWIHFHVPVSLAEMMLDTTFYYFYNEEANITAIRTLEYSIPHDLYSYVQMIQPTTRFRQMRPHFHSVLRRDPIILPVKHSRKTADRTLRCIPLDMMSTIPDNTS